MRNYNHDNTVNDSVITDFISPPLELTTEAEAGAEAYCRHGHSCHLAPVGPMVIDLFKVKTSVFFLSFVVPPCS
jgi:hypothetical protein